MGGVPAGDGLGEGRRMTVSMTAEEAGGQPMVNFEVRVKRITGGSFISRVFAIDEKNDRFLLYDPGEPATAEQYAIESRFYWVDIAKCKLVFVSEKKSRSHCESEPTQEERDGND